MTFFSALVVWIVFILATLLVAARAVLRPHRDPASRVAWVAAICGAPIAGIVAYLLLGETNVGRKREERERKILEHLPDPAHVAGNETQDIPAEHQTLFRLGSSVNEFVPVGGNAARLTPDSNAAIDAMVADIDAAIDHVHSSFYIWLDDHNGCKVMEALKRAAQRGVKCRALADALGSHALIASPLWQDMKDAGVQAGVALRIGNPFLRAITGRVDLRNHRKTVIIDNRICYFGSQNCADPEFRVKPKFAPWVDVFMRFEGPIARQSQYLFASDWMVSSNDDLSSYLTAPLPPDAPNGVPALAIGTGPTVRASAMPEIFVGFIYAASKELFITTPYFVPDDSIIAALCSSARRGVDTTIIFPERNDSWIVAAASRSYYQDMLDAGVKIYEFRGGLLHAKTLTVDGQIFLLGSANMDRRSFDLNYENNVLCSSPELTQALRERQQQFLRASNPVSVESVAAWGLPRRLWNNTLAMLGPIL